jgi:ClpP class serine protease
MKNIPHILQKVNFEPWLITPAGYASVRLFIDSKLAGGADLKAYEDDASEIEQKGTWIDARMDSSGIATIPINGILGHRISGIEKMCGGTDYLDIQKATEQMLGKGARGIMYAFDSAGGMVGGCADLADYIKGLPVPTEAYSDSKCNSAAYWLGSACNHFTGGQSANIGSIGVILPWIDKSKVWEVEGLKYDSLTNAGADLKGAGAGPSLSDNERKYLQEQVDYMGAKFQEAVKSNRPKIKSVVYRAGTYIGEQAQEIGLIDKVGTYADAHDRFLTRVKKGSLVPGPAKNKIQGNKMTTDELKAQHPELYAQLVQEQDAVLKAARDANEAAVRAATTSAMAMERTRLAGLDALAFTPECKAVVDSAKAGDKGADQIAVQIANILAKENESLRAQVGVYKGAYPASRVGSIDPTMGDNKTPEQELTSRLSGVFQKKFGKAKGVN